MSQKIHKLIRKVYPKHMLKEIKKLYNAFTSKQKAVFNFEMKKEKAKISEDLLKINKVLEDKWQTSKNRSKQAKKSKKKSAK